MFFNMPSIDSGLFEAVRRLDQEMSDMFNDGLPAAIRGATTGGFPPVNVGVTPERVEVYLFAAGLDPKALDVSIQQNVLTITGSRPAIAAAEGATTHRQERAVGHFQRVVQLPDDIDPERIGAQYREGVLQITVERREAARPRKIEIH
jgi:HSP20 family protein